MIGGVLAFSAFRQQKDFVTTVLVTILYIGFAYKNLGAIEATLGERQAFVSAIKQYSATGADPTDRQADSRRSSGANSTAYDMRGPKLPCDVRSAHDCVPVGKGGSTEENGIGDGKRNLDKLT